MAQKVLLFGGIAALLTAATFAGQKVGKRRSKPKIPDEYIKVEIRGTLHHGVVAIGGETTGTQINVRDITWELDLGRHKKLAALAEKLNDQKVLVTGLLNRRKGVERGDRWIVTVDALRPAVVEQQRGTNRAASDGG